MNKVKLGEILKIKHGFAFKSENYVDESKYALVTLANISPTNNFQFNREKTTFYGASFPDGFALKDDDLIMPLTEQVVGLFGNTAFVPKIEGITFVLNQRVGKVVPVEGKADKYYLHYLLATDLVKDQLEYRASGTRQRNISPDDIYDVEVFVPDINTQKSIGKYLYDIEQKVNLNHAINDNLEQQSKLLYDYWFTQFDFPDENGKPYRSSGGKMVWNELLKRDIPADFRVVPFLEVASWESNSQPAKNKFIYEQKEGYVRFIQNRDYNSNTYITYIPMTQTLSVVDRFDILMDKYGDAGAVRYGLEGAFNVALGKICVHNQNYKEYIRSFLSSDGIYNYLHNSCMASTRASLNESNLAMLNILIPDENIIFEYEKLLHKIRLSILQNNDETQILIDLRDWLLPMLMNGQATIIE
ncbi:restriction endonuclease subunit S [Anaerovoracaceae bacterium SGI.195]